MGTPQIAYSLNNKAGLPGMLFDNDDSNFISSKPCGATALLAGTMVELVGGVLRVAQGTGDPDSTPPWGVVIYTAMAEPNPSGLGEYLPGMDVPVMRRGRLWVLCAAAAVFSQGVAVNFTHSSTAATPQGYFTNAAVSGTAGSEISATKAVWFFDGGLVGSTPSVAAIDLNLP